MIDLVLMIFTALYFFFFVVGIIYAGNFDNKGWIYCGIAAFTGILLSVFNDNWFLLIVHLIAIVLFVRNYINGFR